MGINITHYKNSTCEYDLTATDADGDTVTLGAGDQMRLKIWRQQDGKRMLDLLSGTPSDNGSTLSSANPTRFRLDQSDANWTPGVYDIELMIVDVSDSSKIRHVDGGVFNLHDTAGGSR